MAQAAQKPRHGASADGAHRLDEIRSGEITRLLGELSRRNELGRGRLMELIYPDLRRLARRHMKAERAGHVLQPTALVNEAYLRLVGHEHHHWKNRLHFFAAASNSMRRILVDHARAQKAHKRTAPEIAIADRTGGESEAVDLVALSQALDALADESPRHARLVELRYFGGLTVQEAAGALGVTPRTIDRDWAAARAWLRVRLRT